MESLGRHLILEYHGCASETLDDVTVVERVMVAAAEAMRAHIVSVHFHHFNPHGISGAVIISESHLTIHTWPEYRYAAVDIFTCGDVVDPWEAHKHLVRALQPERESAMELKRGTFDVPRGTLPSAYEVLPSEP